MKKTITMILALAILFSLCACGNDGSQTPNSSNSSQASTETSTGSTEKPAGGIEGTTDIIQTPATETTKDEDIREIVLPDSTSKLGKDLDYKSSETACYINVDGTSNKPKVENWGNAIVVDSVAAYLDYLESLGFTVEIINTTKKVPYSGFYVYESNFKVSNEHISWTMYLCIQDEKYVEYQFDINLVSSPSTQAPATGENTTGTAEPPTITPPVTETPTAGGTSAEQESLSKTQIDAIVNNHIGRWYLQGYADVCIDVYKSKDYENILEVTAHNFAFPSFDYEGSTMIDAYTVYPQKVPVEDYAHWGGLIEVSYDNWDAWEWSLQEHKLTFNGDSINIGDNKFIKQAGTIDRYFDVCWPEALGTWYLKDNPNSIIKITKESDGGIDTGAAFRIETESFNIVNLSSNGYGFIGIRLADRQKSWDEFGISVKNEVLTITNNNGTRTFYKYITEPPTTMPQPVRVSGVQISKTTLSLKVGDTQQLTATVSPSNADNRNVTWSSSNSSVAQVSSTGKITAKGEGVATITVTTIDGNYTAQCTVTVAAPPATEPPTTEPPTTEPVSDVLIISNTQTISNQTINTDVYITSTGIATFNNVTVNGNIYCYGQLKCSGCTVNNVYAYAYGSMMSCGAFDGTHGKVSGGISCNKMTILDNALDYAFSKWGKK